MDYDVAGHLAMAMLLLGKVGIIYKHRWGFLAWMTGAGMWVVIGYFIGMSSIMLWNALYVVMYAFGYYKWKPNNKVEEIQ